MVGDFLYSRAFEIIVEINKSLVYETLAKTTNVIAQGEVMQLMNIHCILEKNICKNYLKVVF